MKVDLHTHSTYSDGTLEPEDLIQSASRMGITHLALCDHDSTNGLERARAKAKEVGINIIPAIEINTQDLSSVHILGYFIDDKDAGFQGILSRHRQLRSNRAQQILDKLHRMGIKISLSDFNHGDGVIAIGRPHIADKLREKGIVFSRQEAFDKFLGKGRCAYVPYEGPTPQDAIDAITSCKGVPVLAHPGGFVAEEGVASLAKIGLQGIEVYYPSHSRDQVQLFLRMAEKFDLVPTGGSDYHGPGSGHEGLGETEVPERVLDDLLNRKKKLFGSL